MRGDMIHFLSGVNLGGAPWLQNSANFAGTSLTQNQKIQPRDERTDGTGFVRVDAEISDDRRSRFLHRSISFGLAGCVEKNLTPHQSDRLTTSRLSTVVIVVTREGSKKPSSDSRPTKLCASVKSARRNSCFLVGLSDQESTQGNSAHCDVPTKVEKRMGMSLIRLLSERGVSILKGTLWFINLRISTLNAGERTENLVIVKERAVGFLSTATSWVKSWDALSTSGRTSITSTGIVQTMIRLTWNCGSKRNRQGYAWQMWLRSMGPNWSPLDSVSENSKHNFLTILSSLRASLGVGLSRLTFKEAV